MADKKEEKKEEVKAEVKKESTPQEAKASKPEEKPKAEAKKEAKPEEKKESAPPPEAKASKEEKMEEKAEADGYSLDCVYAFKSGMTRFFSADGKSFPATVLDMDEGTIVTQINKKKAKASVQLGFSKKRQQRAKKTEIGHCKKAKVPAFYTIKEFVPGKELGEVSVGDSINPSFLKEGAFIDVQGFSKGKGFQGVMKRWGFKGKFASHGHSLVHRTGGSIGQCTTPGRVIKGKKMPGQMGNKQRVVQNLRILSFDRSSGTLLVHGAVPGGKNAVLRVTRSKKKG